MICILTKQNDLTELTAREIVENENLILRIKNEQKLNEYKN